MDIDLLYKRFSFEVLARDAYTPPRILRAMWKNEKLNHDILILLIINQNTPTEVLREIWIEENKRKVIFLSTLCYFARNPNTPIDILQAMWDERNTEGTKVNFDVLCEIARNPNTPIDILQAMWDERNTEGTKVDSHVIYGLAHNKNIPINILQAMWDERNKEGTKVDSAVLCKIAGNPNTPIDILQAMWDEKNTEGTKVNSAVLCEIAGNTKTPVNILQAMWDERNTEGTKVNSAVLCEIAKNLNTPVKILQMIWGEKNTKEKGVRSVIIFRLAQNPNIPIEILQAMWNEINVKNIRDNLEFIEQLIKNSSTPVEILQAIWNNKMMINPNVVCGLVQNPNIPIEILQAMWDDINNEGTKVSFYALHLIAQNLKKPLPLHMAFGLLGDEIGFPHCINPKSEIFNGQYYIALQACYFERLAAQTRNAIMVNPKDKYIIDFLISMCPNIRKRLGTKENRRIFIDELKKISDEANLPVIFKKLHEIDSRFSLILPGDDFTIMPEKILPIIKRVIKVPKFIAPSPQIGSISEYRQETRGLVRTRVGEALMRQKSDDMKIVETTSIEPKIKRRREETEANKEKERL
ncbi:MAG: hypothetical protein PHY80_00025 [Rickettsiales bacterium]|nr:hypothetical protein [Rickettsiales bacterium]